MKKVSFLLIAMAIMTTSVVSLHAQDPYRHSIGGVVGSYYGVSYKTFLLDDFSLQVDCGTKFLHYWTFDLNPNLMLEKEIKNIGLYWFVGGGASLGFGYYYKDFAFKLGLNAIGGIEYKFARIPLTIQVDVRPGFGTSFSRSGPYPFFDWASCASVRYTF
jgi:hypothetical protein